MIFFELGNPVTTAIALDKVVRVHVQKMPLGKWAVGITDVTGTTSYSVDYPDQDSACAQMSAILAGIGEAMAYESST